MIYINESFANSLAIMHLLQANYQLMSHPQHCYIEAYQNGREQGIIVWGFEDFQAYFIANHRNSDTPRIHKGKYSMQGVSEDAYKNQHNFDSIEAAVAWLVDDITSELDKMAERRKELEALK